ARSRDIPHWTSVYLAASRHRSFFNLAHAEDAGLRTIDNRRRSRRAVDAAVRDGKGAALHLFDVERAVARASPEIGNVLLDLRERFLIAVAHHRHDQALLGPDCDADVIVVLVDDVAAVDLAVDGGNVFQRAHAG